LLSKKIGGAGLDVFDFDGEGGEIYDEDWKDQLIPSRDYRDLIDFPNVIFTPHVAYNTLAAVREMVDVSTQNIIDFVTTGKCENEVTK
jgi:D-lactate dehydrogenase